MSMLSRMRTETWTPTPRWLYLLFKIAETLAGGVALANLVGISQFIGTSIVATVYVGVGIWAWYRHRRIVISTAQGEVVGDFWYHGILSIAAVALVLPTGGLIDLRLLRLVIFFVCISIWWILEVNNYGPMRSGA